MSEVNSEFADISQADVFEIEQRLGLRILEGEDASFMADHIIEGEEERMDVRKVLFAAGSMALQAGATVADIQNDPAFRTIRWLQSQTRVAHNLTAAGFGQQPLGLSRQDRREHFQGRLMHGIYQHTQTLPVSYMNAIQEGEDVRTSDNLLVVAPTGTGKTVVEAKLLHDAGIGLHGMRGLVVVPDQALHRQYRGVTGDDTFRRWLGKDVKISAYWQYDKQQGGDMQIITKQSLEAAVEANVLDASNIDMVVVDEGHIGLEPKLMQRLNDFARVYYFTATPAYSLNRDLRNFFRHVEVGTITDCIYEGIVNDVELYTFRAKTRQEAEALAAQLAFDDIKLGRQAVVYCQPGGRAKQAKDVAGLINDLHAKDSGADAQDIPPIARRVSGYDNQNEGVIKQYEGGDLNAITTVGMMGQGYNGNINTAIILGPKTSTLQLVQRIGRALRPNDQFRTRLIEILYGNKDTITIWNALGLDEIEQGRILSVRDSGELEIGIDKTERNEEPLISRMSQDMREALAPNQPVSKIEMSKSAYEAMVAIEEGFVSAAGLAQEGGVAVGRVHAVLDKEGFHYVGVWTPDEEGTNKYERWYEPSAVAYLAENPIPSDFRDGEQTIYGIMEANDVSKDTVELVIKKLGIVPVERIGRNNKRSSYYTPEDAQRIGESIKAVPLADESDVTVGTLKVELGEKFILRCFNDPEQFGAPTYKRRFPGHGFKGFDYHLTLAEATAIRKAFAEAQATDADISFLEIAALAGVVSAVIDKGVTDEERKQVTLKRATPTSRHGYHLPREVGLKVAERYMIRPLPAHLVPLKVAFVRVPISDYLIRKAAKAEIQKPDSGIEVINLGGTNVPSTCVPWAFLQKLEQQYGLKEEAEAIDYARVAPNANVTFEQWRYSTYIQGKYIDTAKLSMPPAKQWQRDIDVARALRCTQEALRVLAVLAGVTEEHIAAEGTLFHAEFIRRLEVVRNRQYVRHEDWRSLNRAFAGSEFSSEEVRQAALHLAGIGPDDRRLGLDSDGILDVCYKHAAIKRIQQVLTVARRRAGKG